MKQLLLCCLMLVALTVGCKKEQQVELPPQDIQVYEVQTKNVPIYEEFVGQIFGEKDIPIRARVEGFLTGIYFNEGERVKQGDLLYTIDPDPFAQEVAAQESRVAQEQTLLVQAENDLRRIEPLAEMSAVSEQELDMATAKRDAAISSLEAAKANLNIAKINLGYTKMFAPIDGIIGKTLAREGEFVGKDPNPVILNTVSQLRAIRVQFFLSENEYLKVARDYIFRTNKKIERTAEDKVEIGLILADGTEYEHKGRVDFIDRSVDSETGSILIQATFPNPERLIRPGQFARVKIRIRQAPNAILIPQKCASELQGIFTVFVVNSENAIESRQIQIQDNVGEFFVIRDGLKAGEKVVLEGVQKVRAGMVINPVLTEFESQQIN